MVILDLMDVEVLKLSWSSELRSSAFREDLAYLVLRKIVFHGWNGIFPVGKKTLF